MIRNSLNAESGLQKRAAPLRFSRESSAIFCTRGRECVFHNSHSCVLCCVSEQEEKGKNKNAILHECMSSRTHTVALSFLVMFRKSSSGARDKFDSGTSSSGDRWRYKTTLSSIYRGEDCAIYRRCLLFPFFLCNNRGIIIALQRRTHKKAFALLLQHVSTIYMKTEIHICPYENNNNIKLCDKDDHLPDRFSCKHRNPLNPRTKTNEHWEQ